MLHSQTCDKITEITLNSKLAGHAFQISERTWEEREQDDIDIDPFSIYSHDGSKLYRQLKVKNKSYDVLKHELKRHNICYIFYRFQLQSTLPSKFRGCWQLSLNIFENAILVCVNNFPILPILLENEPQVVHWRPQFGIRT